MIYLTSDNHFYHTNIIRYSKRPFTKNLDNFIADAGDYQDPIKKSEAIKKDVEEMNEAMVANWNAVVKPEDTVYHLGDFAFAIRAVQTFTPRLNGTKILIAGNHDWVHPAHDKAKKEEKRLRLIEEYKSYGWSEVLLESSLEVAGVANFRLYHLPYTDPEDVWVNPDGSMGAPRYQKHRIVDDGRPLLCGHVHEKWLFRFTPKGTPMLNIGIDAPDTVWNNGFRPASLDEVVEVYLAQTKLR